MRQANTFAQSYNTLHGMFSMFCLRLTFEHRIGWHPFVSELSFKTYEYYSYIYVWIVVEILWKLWKTSLLVLHMLCIFCG